MSKLRFTVLCFFLIFSISLFAQQSYLVSINLDKIQNPEKLEKLRIPVYHMFEHSLITSVSKELLAELSSNKIEYNILDKSSGEEHYYILSKRNRNSQIEYGGEVLYKSNNSFLVKGSNISESVRDNFLSVELRKKPIHFRNEKILPAAKSVTSTDSVINGIIANINPDSVRNYISGLQSFQTRYYEAPNRDTVANWIKDQFIEMGYNNVVLDSFYYNGTWQKNVVATLEGNISPEGIIIVGGHHDSYSSGNPMVFAPGADDNASGTTAVLEVARAIKKSGYIPESTIKFITFAAEETGLWGSRYFARYAYDSDMKIRLMINHDMISYTARPLTESFLSVNYYTGSEQYRELAKLNTSKFTKVTPVNGNLNSSSSDSYYFWNYGFDVVYFEEYDFSPFYHSPQDVITNYSMDYCSEVIKASCATLISASVIPWNVEFLQVVDAGNGSSLIVNWEPVKDYDFAKCKVFLGTESGVYSNTYETTDTTIKLTGLLEGTKYYVGVSVVDQDGNESSIVESSGVPNSFPLAPVNVTDNPKFQSIKITWNKNLENDFNGYNIYRSESQDGEYLKINQELVKVSSYNDENTSNGIYYYYRITAVDSLNNESPASSTVRSRCISLDQGILLVDETDDGDGSVSKPSDSDVDTFYNKILSGYKLTSYDINEEKEIKLADLGAYSTVIWYGDDFSNQEFSYNTTRELKKYLDAGGNFIYSGFRPSMFFTGSFSMDNTFGNHEFIIDYLKISSSKSRFGAKFKGAKSSKNGYPELHVDSAKTLSGNNFHLNNVESITPVVGASGIYTFESNYDKNTMQGSLVDLPVGVEYLGVDYKTVVLGFPLYYINEDDAKEFLTSVLTSFNEVTGVKDEKQEQVPESFYLSQNYPNPFNPGTTINYTVGTRSRQVGMFVQLKIYDMLGREVATLVNREQNAGYYKIEFDGSNLSSGVYTYVLRASSPAGESSDIIVSKKMLLLK